MSISSRGTPVLSQWRRMREQQQGISPTIERKNDPLLWKQPPFLTVVLLNITKVLPKYCDTIARATAVNAAIAIGVFTAPPNSPSNNHSPSSSPLAFLQWIKKHHPSSADNEEWKAFVSPFVSMATADVLMARLEHLRDPNDSVLLETYQRVLRDLQNVQQVLCEPFLRRAKEVTDLFSSLSVASNYTDEATRLTSAIRALTVVVSVRVQWIHLQRETVMDSLTSTEKAAATATLFLQTIEQLKEEDPFAVQPILVAFMQELKSWKFCLKTFATLEQCQFMETILNLRYWQLHLPPKEYGTQFAEWMRQLYLAVLGLLPIYFDRIRVSATQLYGFDTSLLSRKSNGIAPTIEANANDFDGIVKDFLIRQERLGGPSMAVALVLDAVATSNIHVERGVRIATSMGGVDTKVDARVAWPAIYLRSTRHVTSIPPPPPPTSTSGSGLFRSSQAAILSNWSSAGSVNSSPLSALIGGRKTMRSPASGSSFRKNVPAAAVSAVLEYGPDTGAATTWPHNDWDIVVDLLSRRETVSSEMVQHPNNEENEVLTLESEDSAVYAVPLSSYIHLVVMEVKEEKEMGKQQSHPRKVGLDSREIQSLVNGLLLPRLRRSQLFATTYQNVTLAVPQNSNPTFLIPDRRVGRSISGNDRLRKETGGAACFFLGLDLASTLDD